MGSDLGPEERLAHRTLTRTPHVRVTANLAVSLDGRIAPADGVRGSLGSRLDLDRMHLHRREADAIVVGGNTFRTWPLPYVAEPAALARLRGGGEVVDDTPADRAWWNVIVTRTGPLPGAPGPAGDSSDHGAGDGRGPAPSRNALPGRSRDAARFWSDPRVRPLVLSTAPVALPRGENDVRASWSPADVLDALARRGVGHVLLEGGGGLLGPFLAEDRVDRLHVTLCPIVLGGDVGVAGAHAWSLARAPRLRLASSEVVGDEVYLTYTRA